MKRCWVDVTAEGLNLERLIRMAGEHDIPLRRLKRAAPRRLTALIPEDRLAEFRSSAMDGGWLLTIGTRHGAGHVVDRLERQWVLAACCLLAMCCTVAASQVMWRIVLVDAGTYRADVMTCLDELDIRAPMWKRQVDLSRLRETLTWRYPALARVDCGWRGMTLCISVSAGQAQGETITVEGAGSVIALRDGVVDSVVTTAGTAVVKPGDVVRKGQVLICGEERTGAEEVHPVQASGTVLARVWDGAAVRMPLTETETIYTGREWEGQTVETPLFDLWKLPKSGFVSADQSTVRIPVGGLFIPLSIRRERSREAHSERRAREMEQVKAEAGLAAMRRLRQKVGAEAQILDKWIEYSMIKDGELQAIAVCERVIDIAQRMP